MVALLPSLLLSCIPLSSDHSSIDLKSGVHDASGDADAAKAAPLKSKAQITASRARFDSVKAKAETVVSDVRVERDQSEFERRKKAAEQREVCMLFYVCVWPTAL
jgi:hypothetical protein